MNQPRIRLAELTTDEAAERRGAVVVVPVGAVEQHGPHLPLGTDIRIAAAVAEAAVLRVEGTLLLDPLPIGCSEHHRSFPGTVSLRVRTFMDLVADVAGSLAADGFVPVFVNGHGGNRGPLNAALQELLERGVGAWAVTYFERIGDEARQAFPADSMGHACALETSISLSLWPDLVRGDRIPTRPGAPAYPDPSLFSTAGVVRHRRFEEFGADGIVGDPRLADEAKGTGIFSAAVERVAQTLRRIVGTRAD